jgi:hypothetical protein
MEVKQAVPEHVMDLFEVVKYSTPVYKGLVNLTTALLNSFPVNICSTIISQHLINKPSK